MANWFSTQVTSQNASPPVRVKVNLNHGRIRFACGLFPATNPAPAIADIIYFVRLPVGARILGFMSRLSWNAGTASSTMNLGDNVTVARHLAATAINAAGNATPSVVTDSLGTAPNETSDGSRDLATGVPSATNDCDIRGTIAGAAVATTQTIGLYMAYVQD